MKEKFGDEPTPASLMLNRFESELNYQTAKAYTNRLIAQALGKDDDSGTSAANRAERFINQSLTGFAGPALSHLS